MKFLSNLSLLWNITLCLVHYADLITDALVLREWWMEGFHTYFWILVSFALLTWFLNLTTALYLPYSLGKQILLWVTHLDYAVWAFVDKSQKDRLTTHPETRSYLEGFRQGMEDKGNTLGYRHNFRKWHCILFQSIPSIIVTTHSIFVENITNFIPQASLMFSLINLSFSQAWVGDPDKYQEQIIDWPFLRRTIKKTIMAGLANVSGFLLWGIMAAVTRPLGAWISIPVLLFMSLGGFIPFAGLFILCEILYGIVLVIFRKELDLFLAQDLLWPCYLYIAIGLMVAAVFLSCCCWNDEPAIPLLDQNKEADSSNSKVQEAI